MVEVYKTPEQEKITPRDTFSEGLSKTSHLSVVPSKPQEVVGPTQNQAISGCVLTLASASYIGGKLGDQASFQGSMFETLFNQSKSVALR